MFDFCRSQKFIFAAFFFFSFFLVVFSRAEDDRAYLLQLAKETYASILFLIDPQTGLPYDNSRFNRPDTSVTNIGLYLSALVAAHQLGFEKKNAAVTKAKQTLASLGKLDTWQGFTSSWNNVLELTPSSQDTWVSVLDSGNLAAGLIVTATEFASLKKKADALLNQMRWDEVYDPTSGLLYGGYNLNEGGLKRDWLLGQLGSDARLAYVIGIGRGMVPSSSWDRLSRRKESRYGMEYLVPGWQGGGMFMQYISGIFVDEAGTLLGESAVRFAFAQTVHASLIGSPVWGWSACELPDGKYMGWNDIQDRYITPHASVLAIHFFPQLVITNLRRLETLGARKPYISGGDKFAFGFHDSIDMQTGRSDDHFLVLDQCMLFLSLANYLNNGELRKSFEKHPVIQNAISLIPDLQASEMGRRSFQKNLVTLGAEKIFIQTGPMRIEQDHGGNKTLSKVIRLVNFTNHNYPKARLDWKIFQDETNHVLDEGTEILNLKKYTAVSAAPARFRVVDNRYDSSVFLLETKLTDPHGKVISEELAVFSP